MGDFPLEGEIKFLNICQKVSKGCSTNWEVLIIIKNNGKY